MLLLMHILGTFWDCKILIVLLMQIYLCAVQKAFSL